MPHIPTKELVGFLAQLRWVRGALRELSEHHAFEGEAPEFNQGGCGYVASAKLRRVIDALDTYALKEKIHG